MAEDTDQNIDTDWLKDLPLRSEKIGFDPGDLITCSNCGKANAPNRTSCIYCGTLREGAPATKFQIGTIEDWEEGFNIVLMDSSRGDLQGAADAMSETTGIEVEKLKSIFSAGKKIPLQRVARLQQAESLQDGLRDFGIETMIVDDRALHSTSPPVRLRSIGFGADHLDLELFNSHETRSVGHDELALIVNGTIIEGRSESRERKKLRGSKLLDESSTSSDEPVIDLYSIDDPFGWRIPARGFDFSSLGEAKSLFVGENMKTLIRMLVEFSPEVILVDDYRSVHSLLETVWPPEVHREGRVLDRKDVSTVFKTNNTTQFTKYSRLQWQLRYEEKV